MGVVMRKLVIAGVALVAVAAASLAEAADMPLKAPPAALAPSWTGFYVGLGVGLRSTRADPTVTSATEIVNGVPGNLFGTCSTAASAFSPCVFGEPMHGTTFRFSPYVGLNWQLGPSWVVGVEADAAWADQKTTLAGMLYPAGRSGVNFPFTGSPNDTFEVRTTWDASIRARAGFLVNPALLVYATGGAAWLHVESTSTCSTVPAPAGAPGFLGGNCIAGLFAPAVITDSQTRLGWTLGGGIEAMLWANWFVRAEYRYADFGTISNTDVRSCGALCAPASIVDIVTYDLRIRTHTANFGLAYKFGDAAAALAGAGILAPVYKAPAAVAQSWSGFYLGVGAGMRASQTDATVTSYQSFGPFVGSPSNHLSLCGAVACTLGEPFNGISARIAPYLGFNWQVAPQWLVGVEADWGWADQTTTLGGMLYPLQIPANLGSFLFTGNANDSFAVRTTWDASVRARVGFLATPSVLVYATGGAAWLHVESTSTCNTVAAQAAFCFAGAFSPVVITESQTKLGWTVGGGIEAMFWRNWLARAEYRYADFGTISNTDTRTAPGGFAEVVAYDLRVRTHTALFGLAYKFDWAAPVVAKY
jgi:outer membrane immunogenic protein